MQKPVNCLPPIRTAPPLATVPLLKSPSCPARIPQGGRALGIFGVRMLFRPTASAGPQTIAPRVSNITSNLRLVNQITVRVSLLGSRREQAVPVAADRVGLLRRHAEDAVNAALLEAIDRELALMARGENIASNQRRRAIVGRFLTAPDRTRVIEHFYAVRMQPRPVGGHAGGASDPAPFYGDIVTERRNITQRATYEEHVVKTVDPGAATERTARETAQIADRVLEKLERRLRMERGRHGIL